MIRYLSIFLLFTPFLCQAQCPAVVQDIVDEVQNRLDQSSGYSVEFELDQAFVGETSNKQRGRLLVKGDKFNLKLHDQSFVSDGKNLWIILPDAKEIQIMSLEEETGLGSLSPIDILNQYCNDEFLSRTMGTEQIAGRNVEQIEFTPVDKTDDLFKIRIAYDKSKQEIYQVKTFSKDGSRMTLTASSYNFSPSANKTDFTVDVNTYQGFNIEDLR